MQINFSTCIITLDNLCLVSFQFIPWKKKYFCLKNQDSKCEDEMTKLLDQKGLLELDVFPVNLARCVVKISLL